MNVRQKWPLDATEEFRIRIRITPGQAERWREALRQGRPRDLDKWLVAAADFFVWYSSRERELLVELHAQLDREARERLEAER